MERKMVLVSCPERDLRRQPILSEAKELMKSTGNFYVAGEARDRFFGQLSDEDNFFTGWKGKVDQVLMMLCNTGPPPILLTIKGGPICDRERSHLDTCPGVQSRAARIMHFDTLGQFKSAVVQMAAKGRAEANVQHFDKVFIKVDGEDLWLARQIPGTYCAVAGPANARVPFEVEYTTHEDKKAIRLKYAEDNSYLGEDYRYLYGATTGSAKYDEISDNAKQMWVLNNDYSIDLKYDTAVKFLDRYTFSYMAVNKEATAGNGMFYVESKHDRHLTSSFRNTFVLQKA